jgi:hypothetical protein
MNHWMRGPVFLAIAVGVGGCATLRQVAALRKVDFSLDRIQNGRLAGIDLSRISSATDLRGADLGRIALAVSQKDLPLEFEVNILASNPAQNTVAATMVRMGWSLWLDNSETINGVIDSAVTLPPGQPVTIPMRMRLNLMEFVNGPAQSLVDLAASIAGIKANPTKVSIRAVPSIDTPLGPISYPSPITIVSRKVGGS